MPPLRQPEGQRVRRRIRLARQTGLELATFRLTARRLHQNKGVQLLAKGSHTSRYLANGSQFSGNALNAAAPGFPISVALRYASNCKEFELASPQKSPQCYVLRNRWGNEIWWTWKRFSRSRIRISGRRKPRLGASWRRGPDR